MDKDKFETQSGGHIKEGHQESDVNIKGVVWSGDHSGCRAVCCRFVIGLGMIRFLEPWEKDHEAKLTPMEQQLQKEREPAERRPGQSGAYQRRRDQACS